MSKQPKKKTSNLHPSKTKTPQKPLVPSAIQRYLLVGLSVYIFELLVIVVAQRAGAGSILAVGLSFWLGLSVSFGLQKLFTFEDKRLHHRVVIRQVLLVSLLVVFNFAFTILVTQLLSSIIPAVVCRTLALGTTTLWNFYLYKTKIFSPHAQAKRTTRSQPQSLWRRLVGSYEKHYILPYGIWRVRHLAKKLDHFEKNTLFQGTYLGLSVAILAATTVFWSYLGAKTQAGNADQLVNSSLFKDAHTWASAALPDQHSFLIKWPLFYVVKLFGYTASTYVWLTVVSVALTIAIFVFVLSRIERRPLALGGLCLALASILLLIPAQPYAGAQLPVNMAMLTTRNLEYVVFIAGLVAVAKAKRLRSVETIVGVVVIGLLMASDKLFLSVSITASFVALMVYIMRQRWILVNLMARWLLVSLAAALLATALLSVIPQTHTATNGVAQISGPYGINHNPKSLALGIFYAVGGLLSNFGANPAYDASTLREIPSQVQHHIISPAGPAYVVNLLLLSMGLVLVFTLIYRSLKVPPKKVLTPQEKMSQRLALLLVWTSLAVGGLFVVSKHYYVVDARYLTLSLFAVFVVAANWLHQKKRLHPRLFMIAGLILVGSIASGSVGALQLHTTETKAQAEITHRNVIVAQALVSHRVSTLVGDYWRVVPVKAVGHDSQTVLPLEDCTHPRTVLTSQSWQSDLHKSSFAYLLSFDGSLTDYPNCSLEQIITEYGSPNSSELVAGSIAHPKELLLFYDSGIHRHNAGGLTHLLAGSTVLPSKLNDLPNSTCPDTSIMNIVAHQDDDLLFMSPDLIHDVRAGYCIRSIYLTAGDAGGDEHYWLSREHGTEAAYSDMLRSNAPWIQRTIGLPGGQYVTIANPDKNTNISLIFLRLPDGNVRGEGFAASHHESLLNLETGRTNHMDSVDGQSSYTGDQLVAGLSDLIKTYQPTMLRTQSDYAGTRYVDHSDHRAVGRYSTKAYQHLATNLTGGQRLPTLSYYKGYTSHESQANVTGQDLSDKEAAFNAYSLFDGAVCHGHDECSKSSSYGSYLQRQYTNPY